MSDPMRAATRPRRLRWSVAFLAGALVLVALGVAAVLVRARSNDVGIATPPAMTSPAQPPNILVFVTDDQTVGMWSAMPRTTRLVRDRGITFTRAFVSNPSCCPSRSTILTGDWSHTTGVYTNTRQHGGFRMFYRNGNEQRTIATYLDPTYDTALFGKYLNGYSSFANHLGKHGYGRPGGTTGRRSTARTGRTTTIV